jgi:hypothetical protein
MKIIAVKDLFLVEDTWLAFLDPAGKLHVQLNDGVWYTKEEYYKLRTKFTGEPETMKKIAELFDIEWK